MDRIPKHIEHTIYLITSEMCRCLVTMSYHFDRVYTQQKHNVNSMFFLFLQFYNKSNIEQYCFIVETFIFVHKCVQTNDKKLNIVHLKRPSIIKINDVFTLFLRKHIRNAITYITNKCNKQIMSH